MKHSKSGKLPWLSLITMGVCIIGSGLALYATQQTIRIQNFDLENPLLCTVNEWINCNLALASSYALGFGVPEAWWGFLFYLGIAASTVTASFWRTKSQKILESAFILSCLAVLYTLYKAYLLAFVLQVLCPVCVGMYIANLAIFLLLKRKTAFSFRKGLKPPMSILSLNGLFQFAAVVLFFGAGFSLMRMHLTNLNKLKLDVPSAVEQHFLQSQVALEIPDSAPMWGNPEALVTIVEFSDFQCPTCRTAAFQLKDLLWEFRNEVRFYFMNFPLDSKINPFFPRELHKRAGLAARAAVCAHQMGDFWSYHDDLFGNQSILSRELILRLAEQRGWDSSKFAASLESDETLQRVRADIDVGYRAGVRATPTIFVNGRMLFYWFHPKLLRTIVQRELRGLRGNAPTNSF